MEYHDYCRALHNSIVIPMECYSVASQLILIGWADSRAHSLTIAILHCMISIFHTCINRSAVANIYGICYAHTNIYIYKQNNLLRIEYPCCTIICRASCLAINLPATLCGLLDDSNIISITILMIPCTTCR